MVPQYLEWNWKWKNVKDQCENSAKEDQAPKLASNTYLGWKLGKLDGVALGLELGELDGAPVLGMALGLELGELDGASVDGVELQAAEG